MTNAISSINSTSSATSSSNPQLDQTAFLRLMTTQLQAQDPFNPMDNTQMVAQMAQFSSVAGIAEMNASLGIIANQISEQTALLQEIRNAAETSTSSTPEN